MSENSDVNPAGAADDSPAETSDTGVPHPGNAPAPGSDPASGNAPAPGDAPAPGNAPAPGSDPASGAAPAGFGWQPRPSGALATPHGWQAAPNPWQRPVPPPDGRSASGGFRQPGPSGQPSAQWSPPLSHGPATHHFGPGTASSGATAAGTFGPGPYPGPGPANPAMHPGVSAPRPAPAPAPHRGRAAVVLLAAAVIGLGAGFGGGVLGSNLAASHTDSTTPTLTQQSSNQPTSSDSEAPAAPTGSVQEVARKVLPSVVSVVALSNSGESEGSGIILTESGLMLTNNHVIEDARTLTVQLNDGTTASASVVGTDPIDDLAVLKIEGVSGLKPATLGTSADVQVGQEVVAVGSPLGLSATVTSGIVSALNRPVRTESAESPQAQGTVLSAIQTDAAINPGNSGGPLVDMNGYVIGINSAIAALSSGPNGQAGSIGVGFAIPIDQAQRVAQEIIDTGQASHAVLGANVTSAKSGTRGITTGAEIKSVVPDSGAAEAGLKAGDVVTKVDDVSIESADALVAAIRASKPNGTVQITYVRDDEANTVTVTLGSSTD